MNYEQETRAAYTTRERAMAYKRRQTVERSWARFATWREQAIVARLAHSCGLGARSVVLDAPCGTGILAHVLNPLGCRVVAADISAEMMKLAEAEYRAAAVRGFVRTDLLQLPLARGSMDAVFVLGFLHRVPREVRRRALAELAAVSRGPLISTWSIDGPLQRVKSQVLQVLRGRRYRPAPHRAPLAHVLEDCASAGLSVTRFLRPVPILSSEAVLVLERDGTRRS